MAYSADSFTALEVPTLAKMNKLWSNDASFNDGTGIANNAIIARHIAAGVIDGSKLASYKVLRQDDTTNSTETAARILTGWGVMAVSTATSVVSENVTFNGAFTNKPIVLIAYTGDNTANVANGGGNIIEGSVLAKAHSILTTGFTAYIGKPNGANWGANGYVYYDWAAIGV